MGGDPDYIRMLRVFKAPSCLERCGAAFSMVFSGFLKEHNGSTPQRRSMESSSNDEPIKDINRILTEIKETER